MTDVLSGGREPGSARTTSTRVRRAAAAAVLLLAGASAAVALVDRDVDTPPKGPAAPRAEASATAADGPVLRLAPPLCDQTLGMDVSALVASDEPAVQDVTTCPATLSGGRYLSAAFVGMSSVVPFAVTVPAGWRVRSVAGIEAVDIWSPPTGEGLTVISEPSVRRDDWEGRMTGAPLVTALQRNAALTVGIRRRTNLGPPLWVWADVAAAPGAARRGGDCRRHVRCVPVLWSWYEHRDGAAVAEVSPHRTSRLLAHDLGIAVWIWEVDADGTGLPSSDVMSVLRSIDLWASRPSFPEPPTS